MNFRVGRKATVAKESRDTGQEILSGNTKKSTAAQKEQRTNQYPQWHSITLLEYRRLSQVLVTTTPIVAKEESRIKTSPKAPVSNNWR